MAARFLIVNNGLTEARGHYLETGVAVARAARARGFDVLMAVHARCNTRELPADLPTVPIFRVDHWGHIIEEQVPAAVPLRGELAPLLDTPIEAVLDGRASLRELLDARFAPPTTAAPRGAKAKLARLAARGLPPAVLAISSWLKRQAKHSTRVLRALVPPAVFDWARAVSRRSRGLPPAPWAEGGRSADLADTAPLPADAEGLLKRALGRIPPDHNEFVHYQMFTADLERLLTLCAVGPGDHVYLPTAYGRDAAAILALVHRVGAERMPTFHLEFRHAILSPAELDREADPFRAFHSRTHRAYFDACRAYPESPKVRFYTDTRELAADYEAMAGFAFGVLPIPFRANLIPKALRVPGGPLRVLFLGDLREEKGFTKLPSLVRAMAECGVRFIVPGALHPEEREPVMLTSLAELEAHPPELVERPHRDGFVPAEEYYQLLASADVVLLPYDEKAYRARSSGVFAEAVAAGKPTVVPADTWMAAEQEPGAGECYSNESGLHTALRRVCVGYKSYRAAAEHARARWLARHTPDALVAQLLGAAPEPRTARPRIRELA